MRDKNIVATFEAPTDTLTDDQTEGPLNCDTIIDVADRAIVRNEFVIAYEEPIDDPYSESKSERGYVSVWWKDTDGYYYRKQMMSGLDSWMRTKFGELADGSVNKIERFIGASEVPQP